MTLPVFELPPVGNTTEMDAVQALGEPTVIEPPVQEAPPLIQEAAPGRRPSLTPTRYRDLIRREEPEPEIAIGVVVPFDFDLDWEYWRYMPTGVSLYFTRTPHVNRSVGVTLAKEVGKPAVVARATRALNSLKPAATLYACSSGSFIRGHEGEQHLRQSMLNAGARRAVTTSGAMLDAFRAAGARRVAVATPYTERLTTGLVQFIEEAGFDVVSAHYLGLSHDIGRVSRSTVADLVREASRPDADALFLSCTALRTYGIVASLEEEIGIPVFTSNQVSFWAGLHCADALLPSLDREDGWVLGGGNPMAKSTRILLDAAYAERISA